MRTQADSGTLQAMSVVLIVEDEADIAESLEAYLRREGFRTERATDGDRALELHRAAKPDLVLLDVMLPKRDGLDVLRQLRAGANTPVIMLTARSDDIDKLLGLEMGADDYITKPFSIREVVARVKAVLRRVRPDADVDVLRSGPLELDVSGMIAKVAGHRLDLTPTEFRLLETLMRSPGRVYNRSELLEKALPNSDAFERVVDAHMKNLRRKLDEASVGHVLETVRGVGYRFWSD
jgi:two-component system response regulator AdeR